MVTKIEDQDSFKEVIKNSGISVVHFEADFAEQCKQVNQALDALIKNENLPNIKYYSLSAEKLSKVAIEYNIASVPTVFLFQSNKIVDRVDGADIQKLISTIKSHDKRVDHQVNVFNKKYQTLTNRSRIMLFMKGDRTNPKCGYSREIIKILDKIGETYETFDILQDEEVRQELKIYSDWPTYPQLYLNGDLVGGLDIVKQLLSNGQLPIMLRQE